MNHLPYNNNPSNPCFLQVIFPPQTGKMGQSKNLLSHLINVFVCFEWKGTERMRFRIRFQIRKNVFQLGNFSVTDSFFRKGFGFFQNFNFRDLTILLFFRKCQKRFVLGVCQIDPLCSFRVQLDWMCLSLVKGYLKYSSQLKYLDGLF